MWVYLSHTAYFLMRRGPQIFSLVHPRDLMRISWTSKILNEFLTSKSSRHVWQASFQTIAESERPPRCPSGITEMGYANLLYGQCCMVCGTVLSRVDHQSNGRWQNCANANPPIIAWCALVRLCGPCVEEMYFPCPSSPPLEHLMTPPRTIDLWDAESDNLICGTDIYKILPSFRVTCARIFP